MRDCAEAYHKAFIRDVVNESSTSVRYNDFEVGFDGLSAGRCYLPIVTPTDFAWAALSNIRQNGRATEQRGALFGGLSALWGGKGTERRGRGLSPE